MAKHGTPTPDETRARKAKQRKRGWLVLLVGAPAVIVTSAVAALNSRSTPDAPQKPLWSASDTRNVENTGVPGKAEGPPSMDAPQTQGPIVDLGREPSCSIVPEGTELRPVETVGEPEIAEVTITQECDKITISGIAQPGYEFGQPQASSDEFFKSPTIGGDTGSFGIEASLGDMPPGSFDVPLTIPVLDPSGAFKPMSWTLNLYTDRRKVTQVTGLQAQGTRSTVTVVQAHVAPSVGTGLTGN